MSITPRRTTAFTRDLTTRDDVILAFLSLLLLLLIDATVAAILLRTHASHVSNFGFSVKLVIEHLRDLKFPRLVRPAPPRAARLNHKLLAIAISLLLLILGLEIGILFLTEPQPRPVSNSLRTFRLAQPVLPTWDDVRFHNRASLNRPCSATALDPVDQGPTRLNGCVTTDIPVHDLSVLSPTSSPTTLTLTSDLHEFGSDHRVDLANNTANYTARGFFTLSDGQSRMMSQEVSFAPDVEALLVEAMHRQYVAYLYSLYEREVPEDGDMNITRLNGLRITFRPATSDEQPDVLIFQRGAERLQRTARRYVTVVEGVVPVGVAALRLAHHFFRGTTAVAVAGGNVTDLMMEQGVRDVPAVVWEEHARPMNWLSMFITVGAALVVLVVLRLRLRPVAMADIAGVWVAQQVGARVGRGPLEMGEAEDRYFEVSRGEQREGDAGADAEEYEYAAGGSALESDGSLRHRAPGAP
eukprot:GFKZ01006601.1.p1 GENE.GFKZ01006601.1~~GFKZ01006601.1.p1  ORF type:complete len:512 (+),score=62.62 GFKZ01006601.1:132-1538(+)